MAKATCAVNAEAAETAKAELTTFPRSLMPGMAVSPGVAFTYRSSSPSTASRPMPRRLPSFSSGRSSARISSAAAGRLPSRVTQMALTTPMLSSSGINPGSSTTPLICWNAPSPRPAVVSARSSPAKPCSARTVPRGRQ